MCAAPSSCKYLISYSYYLKRSVLASHTALEAHIIVLIARTNIGTSEAHRGTFWRMEQELSVAVLNTGQLMYSYVDDFCFHGMKVRVSLLDKTLCKIVNKGGGFKTYC